MSTTDPCPCGSRKGYSDCCGTYHSGTVPPDAAALMRSRYSAYVLADVEYLLATWHADTRPPSLNAQSLSDLRWLGLNIKRHQIIDDDHALVEFVARSRLGGGSAQRLHEISRFVREDGRWYYLDGEFPG